MKKIVITGGSLNGNSGAEAMLVTTIQRLKENIPNAEFGIFTPYPKDDRIVWQEVKDIYLLDSSPIKLAFVIFPLSIIGGVLKFFKLNFFRKVFPFPIRFLWEASVLIDVAGVAFIDSRMKFLPFNVLSIYPAFLLKVPVIKFAQAVGPFNKKINRLLAVHCFNKLEHLFARGDKTMEHLQTLSLKDDKFSLAADVAFCNKDGDSITVENYIKLEKTIQIVKSIKETKKKVIGLCPSSVLARSKNGEEYIETIVGIIKELIEKNVYVVVFPNATKEHKPELWRNNDLPLVSRLEEIFGQETKDLTFVNYNLNADGVKSLINILDSVIVSRFHAMVFALSLKTPVFVLGWSHKYMEVMKQFSLQQYVVDFKNSNNKEVLAGIFEMFDNEKQIIQKIEQELPKVRNQSYLQIKKALSILGNTKC
jgi:colanic acid/amylovoran biosynthesis protein